MQALVQTPVLVTLSPTGTTTTTTTTSVYQFPSVVLLLDSRESSLDNRPSIPIHSSPPAPCNNIIKTNGLWSEARERVEDEPQGGDRSEQWMALGTHITHLDVPTCEDVLMMLMMMRVVTRRP